MCHITSSAVSTLLRAQLIFSKFTHETPTHERAHMTPRRHTIDERSWCTARIVCGCEGDAQRVKAAPAGEERRGVTLDGIRARTELKRASFLWMNSAILVYDPKNGLQLVLYYSTPPPLSPVQVKTKDKQSGASDPLTFALSFSLSLFSLTRMWCTP